MGISRTNVLQAVVNDLISNAVGNDTNDLPALVSDLFGANARCFNNSRLGLGHSLRYWCGNEPRGDGFE